jgi:hypothetical protein
VRAESCPAACPSLIGASVLRRRRSPVRRRHHRPPPVALIEPAAHAVALQCPTEVMRPDSHLRGSAPRRPGRQVRRPLAELLRPMTALLSRSPSGREQHASVAMAVPLLTHLHSQFGRASGVVLSSFPVTGGTTPAQQHRVPPADRRASSTPHRSFRLGLCSGGKRCAIYWTNLGGTALDRAWYENRHRVEERTPRSLTDASLSVLPLARPLWPGGEILGCICSGCWPMRRIGSAGIALPW